MAKAKCRVCYTYKTLDGFTGNINEFVCRDCTEADVEPTYYDESIAEWTNTLMSKHVIQIRIASEEGRLDPDIAASLNLPTGKYRCQVCGMLHHQRDEAHDCCLPGLIEYAENLAMASEIREPGDGLRTHQVTYRIRRARYTMEGAA